MMRRHGFIACACGWLVSGAAWGQAVPNNPAGPIFLVPEQPIVNPPLNVHPPPADLPGDRRQFVDALPIVNDGFANDQDVKGSIEPLLEGVRSTDFVAREAATDALLRLPPGRLPEVVDALARANDAETIERLTRVAAHLYLKPRTLLKTRASVFGVWHREPNLSLLGLKFRLDALKLAPGDAAPTMTVLVTEIQPGFPAMQSLRNGDRIVAMGGAGFPADLPEDDPTYFRSRVATLWPGSVVQMEVLRDGRLIRLGVQVAGLPLDGAVTPDAMVSLRQAALAAFLESLKHGDGSQALAAPAERHMVWMRDDGEGGIVLPMSDTRSNERN